MTTKLSKRELKLLEKKVVEIAKAAGLKLNRRQKKLGDLKITMKEAQGVVSVADIEAEEFLIKKLSSLIEGAEFLAEESAFKKYGGKKGALKAYKDKEFVWIIDPLDGTTNFLNNMDYFAVCVCLAYKGEPLLGVVHRPVVDETYMATKNGGAFFSRGAGKKQKLLLEKKPKKLKDSLLVTGFACEKGEVFNREFTLFRKMMLNSRGIRRMGSAALDMCHVSRGVFDAFWERGLAPWDVAAAALILQEAGGEVSDYRGQGFNPFQETIVASNKAIKREVLKILDS